MVFDPVANQSDPHPASRPGSSAAVPKTPTKSSAWKRTEGEVENKVKSFLTPRAARKAGVTGLPVVGWQGRVKAQTKALEARNSDIMAVPYAATKTNDKSLPPAPAFSSPSPPSARGDGAPTVSPGKENYAPPSRKATVPASAFQTPTKRSQGDSRRSSTDQRSSPTRDHPLRQSPDRQPNSSQPPSPIKKTPSSAIHVDIGEPKGPHTPASAKIETPPQSKPFLDVSIPSLAGPASPNSPAPTPPSKYPDSPVISSTPLRQQIYRGHQRAHSTPQSAFTSSTDGNSTDARSPASQASPIENAFVDKDRHAKPEMDLSSPQSLLHDYRSPQDHSRLNSSNGRANSFSTVPNTVVASPPPRGQRDSHNISNHQNNNDGSLEERFSSLMESMQISDGVRKKMLALEPSVKEGMLASPPTALAAFFPGHQPETGKGTPKSPGRVGKHAFKAKSSGSFFSIPRKSFATPAASPTEFPAKSANIISQPTTPKFGKKDQENNPAFLAMLLQSRRLDDLTEEDAKKLRIVLRTATVEWCEEWVRFGGYDGLLNRLGDMLALEWREEQRGDKVLHELLRCLKALLLSEIGRQTLASKSPTPFRELAQLLYSEKKPGDLICRQVIIELYLGVFDVYPSGGSPILHQSEWKKPLDSSQQSQSSEYSNELSEGRHSPSPMMQQKADDLFENSAYFTTTEDRNGDRAFDSGATAHELVRSLVIGPPDERDEAQPEFMKGMRKPRLFKRWVRELEGVAMDYFWIFCHSKNRFWRLEDLNEADIEAPKVPGGMTGGVENEAMGYCRMHLRLINRLWATCSTPQASYQLHSDLFLSGFERILVTLRKASTEYYPGLHLELARYVRSATSSGCDVPQSIWRYVTEPKLPGCSRNDRKDK